MLYYVRLVSVFAGQCSCTNYWYDFDKDYNLHLQEVLHWKVDLCVLELCG